MHYTKSMIELVFEIRKRVNAQTKPGIKLANPELLNELGDIYHSSKDVVVRTLIKELLSLAGGDWPQRLTAPNAPHTRSTVKTYRGQVSLEPSAEKSKPEPQSKSTRYYRGVKIA